MKKEQQTNNKIKTSSSITPEPPKQQIKKKKMGVKKNYFKDKYFEFYDDVKTHNNGPYDW